MSFLPHNDRGRHEGDGQGGGDQDPGYRRTGSKKHGVIRIRNDTNGQNLLPIEVVGILFFCFFNKSVRTSARLFSSQDIQLKDHMGIQIDHIFGFHSADQSKCTKSSGSPAIQSGWLSRRSSFDSGSAGIIIRRRLPLCFISIGLPLSSTLSKSLALIPSSKRKIPPNLDD